MHTELIISLAAIAGAAAMALVCDFLRAKNAQLRDAMKLLQAHKAVRSGRKRAAWPRANQKPARAVSSEAQAVPSGAADERTTSGSSSAEWLIARAAARAAAKQVAEAEPDSETDSLATFDAQLHKGPENAFEFIPEPGQVEAQVSRRNAPLSRAYFD